MQQLRLFVALDLPAEIKTVVAQAQTTLRASWQSDTVRWVNPSSTHITIKYLGDTDQLARIKVELALVGTQVQPFALHTMQPGVFPHARQPRIVWLGVGGDLSALARLQQCVEAHLAPLGFPSEQRVFVPHITLGRVKYNGAARLEVPSFAPNLYPASPTWNAFELVLMQSETGPQGAHYTPLHAARFDVG